MTYAASVCMLYEGGVVGLHTRVYFISVMGYLVGVMTTSWCEKNTSCTACIMCAPV